MSCLWLFKMILWKDSMRMKYIKNGIENQNQENNELSKKRKVHEWQKV